MEINTEVWGDPENWISFRPEIDGKRPEDGRQTLNNLWSNNHIGLNQKIDWSISNWGINSKSCCQPSFICVWGDDANGYNAKPIRAHEFDDSLRVVDNIPFVLAYNFASNNRWDGVFRAQDRYLPELVNTPHFNTGKCTILSSFNYQKVKLVPYICHTNSSFSSFTYSTIEAFESLDFTSPRYVVGIYYKWGMGTSTGDVTYWTLIRDLPVDRREITDYFMPYDGARIVAMNSVVGFRYGTGFNIDNSGVTIKKQYIPGSEQEAYQYVLDTSGENYYGPYHMYRYGYSVCDWFEPIVYDETTTSLKVIFAALVNENTKEEIFDNIKREVAYIGLPFCSNETSFSTKAFTDPSVYLPKFDSNGITTGEYTNNLREKVNLPNFDWTNEIDSGYEYDRTTPKNSRYEVTDEVNENGNIFPSSFKIYYTNYNGIYNFLQAVENNLDTNLTYEDVVRRVISLRSMPFEISTLGLNQENVKLGEWDSQVQMYRGREFHYNGARYIFGPVRIPRYYDNFLDYTPYTSITLYCPFCGTIELDNNIYIGHEITVKMAQDINTGQVMAYVFVDGHLQDTMTGTGNQDVAFSGELLGTYAANQARLQYEKMNNVYTGVNAVLGNLAGAGISASFGNEMGFGTQLAMATTNAIKYRETHTYIKEQMERMTPGRTLIQKGATSLSSNMEPYPSIWITRTRVIEDFNSTAYGHSVGFACWKSGKIKEFVGLSQFANPDLSGIPCTEDERDMIAEFLTNGVRL